MDILLLGAGESIRIYKSPTYTPPTGGGNYPNYTGTTYYKTSGTDWNNIWIAVGYKNDQGKCPGLMNGLPCYKDELRYLNFTESDPCAWQETVMTVCGFTNFKMRVNISPISGTPVTQLGTPKPVYCPGESVTFEVPCNMKGKDLGPFYLYYKEGSTGSQRYIKQITGETFTIGEGYDFTPRAGVITYFKVTSSKYGLTSEYSGGVRFGAPPPTATVTPLPPACADGDDWSISITNAASAEPAVTAFKANIFHESNTGTIPDGYATFNGSTGTIRKNNILSSRTFVPGTRFRIVLENDFSPTTYGACSSDLGFYRIANKNKIAVSEITPAKKNVSCHNAADGEVQLSIVNGDGNYTITFDAVPFTPKPGSPANQPVINGLAADTYTVKVKDTNCETDPITVIITEPAELTASVEIIKDLDCSYSTDGQLKVNIAGGTTPYNILWSNNQATATATGFGAGEHTVTVTDAGCPAIEASEELTAPLPINITLSGTPPTCPGSDDGSMEVSSLENTSGTIQYEWSTTETTPGIFGLTADTYTVTVTMMDNGRTCTAQASQPLNDPPAWSASITSVPAYNGAAIQCNGYYNGTLEVTVEDGAGQAANGSFYTWSTGESGVSKKSITGLNSGQYSVTVQYNGVCEATDIFILDDPDPVAPAVQATSNYNGQSISCSGEADASLRAAVTGGTGAYTYAWSTGGTGNAISGVGAGEYSVRVTDANGCEGEDVITIDDPVPVEALIVDESDYTGYGISCHNTTDGFITAAGSGGTGVYTYTWSNSAATATATGLGEGTYTVTVADDNGCPSTAEHTLTAPTAVGISIGDTKHISCFEGSDGQVVLAPSGGAGGFEFSNDGGAFWQPEEMFDGLTAGTYTFTVHDANNCPATIEQTLNQPTAIAIAFTGVQPAFCNDPRGEATAEVTGGVGFYTYEWKDAQQEVLSTAVTLQNAKSGLYTLDVRDGNNCPATGQVPITSTDGAKISTEVFATRCFDSSDGRAVLTVTEGDGPFIIAWPDGQNTLEGESLAGGTYNVLVTDAHDCTVIEAVTVPSPAPLQVQVAAGIMPTCHGDCDGEMTLEASGGVGNYAYEWNGTTTPQQDRLCAGIYPVKITDENNCVLTRDIELAQPDVIHVNVVNATLPTCRDGCDGAMEVAASGGNGTYQYEWGIGGNTTQQTDICPGGYLVKVTDIKGCTGEETVTLENTPPLPVDLGGGVTLCVGQAYVLDGGTGWMSYAWGGSTGVEGSGRQLTVNEAGSYWLEVFDDKGCVGRDTFLLETSYDLLKASFMIPAEAYEGDTIVMIDISWPVPQSIEWNYPVAMQEIADMGDVVFGRFNEAGTYEIGLDTRLGECRDEIYKTITIIKGRDGDGGGRLGYEEYVIAFTLHPNPNNGAFEVGIELLEESDVVLSVWHAPTGVMLKKFHNDGKKTYHFKVDLRPLSSGAYVLRMDHNHGKEYIRFVVR